MLHQIDKWHKTRTGLLVFAGVELAIAYIGASLAINDGNLLVYIGTLIFLIGFLQNFVKLIWSFFHARNS